MVNIGGLVLTSVVLWTASVHSLNLHEEVVEMGKESVVFLQRLRERLNPADTLGDLHLRRSSQTVNVENIASGEGDVTVNIDAFLSGLEVLFGHELFSTEALAELIMRWNALRKRTTEFKLKSEFPEKPFVTMSLFLHCWTLIEKMDDILFWREQFMIPSELERIQSNLQRGRRASLEIARLESVFRSSSDSLHAAFTRMHAALAALVPQMYSVGENFLFETETGLLPDFRFQANLVELERTVAEIGTALA